MTVSVCIPTFNQEKFIEEAVKSAYHQTFKPIEIIVSDDASSDSTGTILKKLQVEIPILKVIKHNFNQGISKNVNSCLRIAQGDLVVRLDSDDILHEKYIESFVPFFQDNENLGFGHCSVKEIDSKGNCRKLRILFRKEGIQSGTDALKDSLYGYKVAANIIIFRKTALERVGFLKSKIDFAEDYYLASSISEHGYGNVYLKSILASYRVWSDHGQLRSRRKLSEILGLIAVYDEVLEPAFLKRGWSTNRINSSKENLAIRQADCLGRGAYSLDEKKKIVTELNRLSSTFKARTFYFVHLHGLGGGVRFFMSIKNRLKQVVKFILLIAQAQ